MHRRAGPVDLPAGGLLGSTQEIERPGMDRVVDHSGIEPDMLHDVDLAALGPGHGLIGREHPDRGPGAATAGQLRADLIEAIGPGPRSRADQPRRAIFLSAKVFQSGIGEVLAARLDDQPALLDPRILGPGDGVILLLVVVPPLRVAVRIVAPVARVGRAARIELVCEDQLVSGRGAMRFDGLRGKRGEDGEEWHDSTRDGSPGPDG